MGRSFSADSDLTAGWIIPTSAAIGPELYAGSSGVALFLAELYAATDEPEYRRTALGAAARSVAQLARRPSASPLSLYLGDIGVGLVARTVAALTEDASMAAEADALFGRIVTAPAQAEPLDLMGGIAGAISALLAEARVTGLDIYLERACSFGEEFCRMATREGTGYWWHLDVPALKGFAKVPLAGLAHGAAGIGLALFALHSATGRPDFLKTARAAYAFDDSVFRREQAEWPDLSHPTGHSHAALAWCQGAHGVALSRLRESVLDPDRAASYLETAQSALAITFREIDRQLSAPRVDASLGRGLAGLGDVVAYAGQVLGDQSCRERALRLAQSLIDRHVEKGDWPSGVPSAGLNPSLMLGLAGIGYWLLRLRDLDNVPSILAPA